MAVLCLIWGLSYCCQAVECVIGKCCCCLVVWDGILFNLSQPQTQYVAETGLGVLGLYVCAIVPHGWVPLCSGISWRFFRYLSGAKDGDDFEIRDSDTYQKTAHRAAHRSGRLCAVFHHCFVFPLFCSVEIGFSIFPQCFQWFIFWFFDFLIISFLILTLGFHCCLFWVCRLRQVSVDFIVLLFNMCLKLWNYL